MLLRGLLLGSLRLTALLSSTLLPAALALTVPEPCRLPDLRILLLQFRQRILSGLGVRQTDRRLRFTADLGHLRGDLLSEGRTVKLQQPLDFVIREVLVVNRYELIAFTKAWPLSLLGTVARSFSRDCSMAVFAPS